MTNYYFSTKEFGLTDKGIHLLRSGFNYDTIDFSQIHKAEIRHGKQLNNWFVIMVIGLALLTPGLYLAVRVIDILLTGNVSVRGARIILFLFIPVIGGYFIYSSLQTGEILKISYGQDKNEKFSLRDLSKKKRIEDFKLLMKDKLDNRLSTQ